MLESHLSTTAVDNLLPGSKKGLAYVVENSQQHIHMMKAPLLIFYAVFFLWKIIELNKVLSTDLSLNSCYNTDIWIEVHFIHDGLRDWPWYCCSPPGLLYGIQVQSRHVIDDFALCHHLLNAI
jgi:hypothetical protein